MYDKVKGNMTAKKYEGRTSRSDKSAYNKVFYSGPVRIRRCEPTAFASIGAVLLRQYGLSEGMNEHLIISAWKSVTGAGDFTLSAYVKNRVLYCSISSSVVRSQLFLQLPDIVKAVNSKVLEDPLFTTSETSPAHLTKIILK